MSENRPDESPASNASLSLDLGELIPDLPLSDFLQIMKESFPDVSFDKVHYHYYRFRYTHQHPADPERITYPIYARERGTVVGSEQIYKLFEKFNLSIEKFKEELKRRT